MNKKHSIHSQLMWLIICIIIIIPIHLSYNSLSDFAFNVIHYPRTEKEYLFTLPVSFLFFIPFLLDGLINIRKDKVIFFFFIFFILINVFGYLNHHLEFLILLAKIFLPILALLGFEMFFKKKFKPIKKNITQKIMDSTNTLKFVFTIIFAISVISAFYFEKPYTWLVPEIVIFNYYQYFPLIFILLLGMLGTRTHSFIFVIIYIFSFYIFDRTTNYTFFALLIIFGLYCLLSFIFKRYIIYLTRSYIIFLVTIIFCYPFLLYIFDIYFIDSLVSRKNLIQSFFSLISFYDFFSPIKIFSGIPSKHYHNELLVLISAIGFFGTILFYFIFLKRIWFISKIYPCVSIALTLYVFFSGITVTTNLHPYTFMISAFLVSYYYVISRFKLS